MKSVALHGRRRKSSPEQVRARCARAKAFERSGRYEEARDALGDLWRGVGVRPDLTGMSTEVSAEVLLRVGAISSGLGTSRQLRGVQEAAKDLISEGWQLFDGAGNEAGSVESRVELARCYWRLNCIDEARVMLEAVLDGLDESEAEQRGVTLLWLAVLEVSAKHFEVALKRLNEVQPLIESLPFPYLKGSFYNTRANTLKYLGKEGEREGFLDGALIDYAMASKYFSEAGHPKYSAGVMNNHAMLLKDVGQPGDAHELLDAALELVHSIREKGVAAQIHDTRARVHISEGRFDEAVYAARRAVRILEDGDEGALRHESLTTYATALARAAYHCESESAFLRAADLALLAGDTEGAGTIFLSMIEELGDRLDVVKLLNVYSRADSLLVATPIPGIKERLLTCIRQTIFPRVGEVPERITRPAQTNLYRFPVRGGEQFRIYLHDGPMTFRLTTVYSDGEVVLALTPDGCIVATIRRLDDGRIRLEGQTSSLFYLSEEVIVVGVAQYL